MKRIISIMLALLAVLSICACGGNGNGEGGEGEGGESNGTLYKGVINGDDCELTIDGTTATIKITKFYKQQGLEHTYVSTLTTTLTTERENTVLDFTKEGAKGTAKYTVFGADREDYINTLKNLSYKSDPVYLEWCDGNEVEITTESKVWDAIGLRDVLTVKLNDADKTFEWIIE